MSNFKDKYAKCPFYVSQDAKKIHCAGVVEGCYTHLAFATQELKDEHAERRCHSLFGYLKCPIYLAIAKKYEKDKK